MEAAGYGNKQGKKLSVFLKLSITFRCFSEKSFKISKDISESSPEIQQTCLHLCCTVGVLFFTFLIIAHFWSLVASAPKDLDLLVDFQLLNNSIS